MIHQIDSHEFNNMFQEAKNLLNSAQDNIIKMQDVMSNRLAILNAESIYQNVCLQELLATPEEPGHTINLFKCVEGLFSLYYFDVHAKFLKEPLNLFNIPLTGPNSVYFREDVILLLNHTDKEKGEDVTECLKHDNLQNYYFFKNFKDNHFTLTMKLKDYQTVLGPTRFNMIELDGFLPGSFTLDKIKIYQSTDPVNNDIQAIEITDFYKLGKNHILLDQKYQFYQIVFEFKLNHNVIQQDQIVYPFGIKHLYLLDVDLDPESHIIAKVVSPKPLRLVKNDCVTSSNRGVVKTTLEENEISLYLRYEEHNLYMPFKASTANRRYEIPISTNTFYAHIPLNSKACLSAIRFEVENFSS